MLSPFEEKKDTLPVINMQCIEERLETYMIDSDAESDEILKEHYKNEKKGTQNIAYSRMVEEIKLKTEERVYEKDRLQELIGDYSEDDDDTTNYMITQYKK